MNELHIIDTTLRDGHLSLCTLGMRTGAMLAIAEQMDQCGFQSMEFFGFAGYIKYVREHKENPWDWMGIGAKKFRRTRLRYHGGLATGFEKIPRSVRLLMIERVVAHGITLTRSSDPWNDYEASAVEIDGLKKLGMDVVSTLFIPCRHATATSIMLRKHARRRRSTHTVSASKMSVAYSHPSARAPFSRLSKRISAILRSSFMRTVTMAWHRSTMSKPSSSARIHCIPPAACQWFVPAIDLQCGIECPGAWL